MIYLSTPAIVLGKEPSGEANLKLSFYTKNYGKIEVLAKGGRKINAKLIPHLSIVNLVDLELVLKTQFRLIGAEVKDLFRSLKKEEKGLALALGDLSFLDSLAVAPEKDLKIWFFLLNYLKVLDFLAKKEVEESLFFISSIAFKLKLMKGMGYSFSDSETRASEHFSASEKTLLSLIASKEKFASLFKDFLSSPIAGRRLDFLAVNGKIKNYFKGMVPYEMRAKNFF